MDVQPRRSTRVSQSLNGFPSIQTARSSRGSQSGSYINGSNRGSNQSSHSDILNESRGAVDDTVKLRIVIKPSIGGITLDCIIWSLVDTH